MCTRLKPSILFVVANGGGGAVVVVPVVVVVIVVVVVVVVVVVIVVWCQLALCDEGVTQVHLVITALRGSFTDSQVAL
jgi:hypothetical protein